MNKTAIAIGLLLSLPANPLLAFDFGATEEYAPTPSEAAEQNAQQQRILQEVEIRYGETAALLKSLQWQIEQKRRNLNNIRRNMHARQYELDRESKELVEHVKAAYLMGRQEKLKLLLNQQNPALSNRMMVYYGYLNRERLAKLAAIEKAMDGLEQLDKQQQSESALLEQALTQKKSEQALLTEYRSKRKGLLAQTARDYASVEQRLAQMKDSETKLKALLSTLHNGPIKDAPLTQPDGVISNDDIEPANRFTTLNSRFSALQGKLPWPAKGRIERNAAGLQSADIQNGVLIAADEGTEVHAVAKGKVAFAEWLQNYGLLIIIDHGEGYMSLYAFNQSLYKQKDDPVEAGEVVAAVGQSGGRNQPGLYFGLRKQGTPVDPLKWCR